MLDESKKYLVYMHTCPNGKVYIGLTSTSFEQRCGNEGYNYKKNTLFYRAIQKYGWQNIKHEILFDGLSKEEAEQKEIELITKYKSNQSEFGYNISSGGEGGNAGVNASVGTRQKMSEAHKGEKNNFYGKSHTEEAKEKNRIAHLGRSAWNKGLVGVCHCSEETRKKMSLAQKGEKNHFYGKHHTAETIEKIRASRRKRGELQ